MKRQADGLVWSTAAIEIGLARTVVLEYWFDPQMTHNC
jgi:hypothetical protein